MDFVKGKGIEGQVNKAIDQAAGVAKDKIGELTGGKQSKDKKQGGGLNDMVSGAVGKAAANQAADQALTFGKNLIGK